MDEDGEGGSETTATIPLGSDVGSDSELTDEDEEERQAIFAGLPALSDNVGTLAASGTMGAAIVNGTASMGQNS